MTLEALIFDVDGTLADTEETHRQAFNYAFVRYGLDWEWSRPLYRELLRVSGGKERIAHFIAALEVSRAEKSQLLRLVPAIHSAKTEIYTELIGDGRCTLRPGVARLLAEAQEADLKLAVASTTTSANVHALLARHGAPRFHTIACGDLVPHKKPAPDIYDVVLSTLGLPADQCVAFEDSANGVRAATAAGLFTVVTPSQWTVGEPFDRADLELPHLGDEHCPLPPEQAVTVGAPWLGLEQLRALHTAAFGQVAALARVAR
jgi:HAD superfamily hydrolase (TIGR01509 family)